MKILLLEIIDPAAQDVEFDEYYDTPTDCNNCGWEGFVKELKTVIRGNADFQVCPICGEDWGEPE